MYRARGARNPCPSRRFVQSRSCAAAHPPPCCRAAFRPDNRATPDTSRTRFHAMPASASWRRHRNLQKTADSETVFSCNLPRGAGLLAVEFGGRPVFQSVDGKVAEVDGQLDLAE